MCERLDKLLTLRLEDCCWLLLHIKDVNLRNASPSSVQKKICRDIISNRSFRGTLACPTRDSTQLTVVGNYDFLRGENEVMRKYFHTSHLEIIDSGIPSDDQVKKALSFSLPIWLEAHQWYRLNKSYLIYNDFLVEDCSLFDVVEFDVDCIPNGNIYVRARGGQIEFEKMTKELIRSDQQTPCRVLPNFGYGHIVGVHDNLSSSPFSSYTEMKRYWKNVYGYDLPPDTPHTFFDVRFRGSAEAYFYPFFCVAVRPFQAVDSPDGAPEKMNVQKFVEALFDAVGEICGQRVELEVKHSTPAKSDIVAKEQNVNTNLSSKEDLFVSDRDRNFPSIAKVNFGMDQNHNSQPVSMGLATSRNVLNTSLGSLSTSYTKTKKSVHQMRRATPVMEMPRFVHVMKRPPNCSPEQLVSYKKLRLSDSAIQKKYLANDAEDKCSQPGTDEFTESISAPMCAADIRTINPVTLRDFVKQPVRTKLANISKDCHFLKGSLTQPIRSAEAGNNNGPMVSASQTHSGRVRRINVE